MLVQLMGEEPDLDPEITKDFFEANILQFDPSLLTENGMMWVTASLVLSTCNFSLFEFYLACQMWLHQVLWTILQISQQ